MVYVCLYSSRLLCSISLYFLPSNLSSVTENYFFQILTNILETDMKTNGCWQRSRRREGVLFHFRGKGVLLPVTLSGGRGFWRPAGLRPGTKPAWTSVSLNLTFVPIPFTSASTERESAGISDFRWERDYESFAFDLGGETSLTFLAS